MALKDDVAPGSESREESEQEAAVASLKELIHSKITDPDFHRTFDVTITQQLNMSSGIMDPETQLRQYQILGLQSLRLLEAILLGKPFLDGWICHNASTIAVKCLNLAKSHCQKPLLGLEFYRDGYYCNIFLCEMALSPAEQDCKFQSANFF